MDIINGLEMCGLMLFSKKSKVLILGDLHIGYEEYLTSHGVLIPKLHLNEMLKSIEKVIKTKKPKYIVINGDIKHEFGSISEEEWRNTLKLIDFLSQFGTLILVRGNHDTILGPIARKRTISIVDYFYIDDLYVCHGHRIPSDSIFVKSKTIIIGHEHPAIKIDDGIRRETYKCFLEGTFQKKKLIVMPSLNPLYEGTNILNGQLLSPFLKDISKFRIFVVGDKSYDFGLVREHLKKQYF